MSLDGSEVRVLEDNEGLKELLKDYRLSYPEFFKFKTSEQVELNGYMIKPTDFNQEKIYPLFNVCLWWTWFPDGEKSVESSEFIPSISCKHGLYYRL